MSRAWPERLTEGARRCVKRRHAVFALVQFDPGQPIQIQDVQSVHPDESSPDRAPPPPPPVSVLSDICFPPGADTTVVVLGLHEVDRVGGITCTRAPSRTNTRVTGTPGGTCRAQRAPRRAAARRLAQSLACTGSGSGEPLGIERLQQVVDRVHLEGTQRVLVVGGREHDCDVTPYQFDDLEAVQLGHLHVEEQHVRPEVGDRLHGLEPVRTLGNDLDAGIDVRNSRSTPRASSSSSTMATRRTVAKVISLTPRCRAGSVRRGNSWRRP